MVSAPTAAPGPRLGNPLTYPDNVWRCPVTGTRVQMEKRANARQRHRLLEKAQRDTELQQQLMEMCRQSFPFWCNLFAWTFVIYQVKETGQRIAKLDEKDTPFALWPCQEKCWSAIEIARAAGRSIAIEKSRDMGATWLVLAWMVWMARFHGAQMGVASRKEDLVDKTGDPDALYTKIDYLVKWMPKWMRGRKERTAMHIGFHGGGTIDGETTNKDAFRGGRKHAILLDEAAAMDNLSSIVRASKDAGLCIYVSTHEEVSYFLDLCTTGRVDVFQLGWYDHPEKGIGRELIIDENSGEEDYTSPWLKEQEKTRDKKDLALNVKMKPGGAGSLVFDLATLNHQLRHYGRDPVMRGIIRLGDDEIIDPDLSPGFWPLHTTRMIEDYHTGKWMLWFEPIEDLTGRLRPDQRHDYALGIDIGDGVGATPSVISVVDVDTGEKVARWSCRDTRPEAFSHIILQAAHWFGGRERLPLIVVEANGGRGQSILIDLKKWGYPRIYQHADPEKKTKTKMDAMGWHSNRVRKKVQLSVFGTSMFSGRFKNPDIEAINQAKTYKFFTDDDGNPAGIGPQNLAGMNDEQQAEHGDLVIADMLADLGRIHAGKLKPKPEPPGKHSVAYHRQRLNKNKKLDPWRPRPFGAQREQVHWRKAA